jgi:hypothetical protein
MGIPLVQFFVLSLSDAPALESMEPSASIRLNICQWEAIFAGDGVILAQPARWEQR